MNILRPLSPHLPIYKPQLTLTFTNSHRISGAFLATIVFFFHLLYLKIGFICFTYENVYLFFFYSSKLILISVEITAFALSYHLYNGVRILYNHRILNKVEYSTTTLNIMLFVEVLYGLLYPWKPTPIFRYGHTHTYYGDPPRIAFHSTSLKIHYGRALSTMRTQQWFKWYMFLLIR